MPEKPGTCLVCSGGECVAVPVGSSAVCPTEAGKGVGTREQESGSWPVGRKERPYLSLSGGGAGRHSVAHQEPPFPLLTATLDDEAEPPGLCHCCELKPHVTLARKGPALGSREAERQSHCKKNAQEYGGWKNIKIYCSHIQQSW